MDDSTNDEALRQDAEKSVRERIPVPFSHHRI
jgi:hypothetical protein